MLMILYNSLIQNEGAKGAGAHNHTGLLGSFLCGICTVLVLPILLIMLWTMVRKTNDKSVL